MKTRRRRPKPVHTLPYRVTRQGVPLDKAPAEETDNPFAVFSEWSSEADEKAYRSLCPSPVMAGQKARSAAFTPNNPAIHVLLRAQSDRPPRRATW